MGHNYILGTGVTKAAISKVPWLKDNQDFATRKVD